MSLSYKVAITTAVVYSGISLYDAVHHGVTGHGSAVSDEYGASWVTLVVGVVAMLAYAALAVALVAARATVDRGSRFRRLLRQLLIVDFATLAAVFGIGTPFLGDPESLAGSVIGIAAGVAFLAMFVLSFALGVSILRIRDVRVSAVLLVAVVPLIAVTVALDALGSDFAHPAYAETAIYLAAALLARTPGTVAAATTNPAPVDPEHAR